uniref:Saposin B-type domain-containing protein n=1 Tax=Plectus sambesii TaxID=2011161 RepID=A0A914XAJ8_9BILA
MKVLIVLAVLCAFVYAKPQEKGLGEEIECDLCHYFGPTLEDWADKELSEIDDFMKAECRMIPFIADKCVQWVADHLDEIVILLKTDECISGCIACNKVCGCDFTNCKPSCRKECPSC